jgi:hypothetical protein
MNKRFFYIDIGYATFGIESENDIVNRTPLIANWMLNKTLQEIKPWLIKKKAIVKEIKNEN